MPLTPSPESASSEVAAYLGLFPAAEGEQLRYLVTAGPTYEDIDKVRFLGNRATGQMGMCLARAAQEAGHQVLLILGPTPLPPPAGVACVRVRSAREMEAATAGAFEWCDVLCMAAAVADYRPEGYIDGKLHKSEEELVLRFVRNPDILLGLKEHRTYQVIVGFSLEPEIDPASAEKKRVAKGMDLIVANTQMAFGGSATDAVVLERNRDPVRPGTSKEELSGYIVERSTCLSRTVRAGRSKSARYSMPRKPAE